MLTLGANASAAPSSPPTRPAIQANTAPSITRAVTATGTHPCIASPAPPAQQASELPASIRHTSARHARVPRGVDSDSWEFLLASKPGLSTAEQKAELIALLDRAQQLKMNAVIFQVRPACDALYRSDIDLGPNTSPASKAVHPSVLRPAGICGG